VEYAPDPPFGAVNGPLGGIAVQRMSRWLVVIAAVALVALLAVPVTSASVVRHLRQFNSPDRTIWCGDRSEVEGLGALAATSCFATLAPSSFTSTVYAGVFSTSGKVETCTLAPPFDASRHCILGFVTSAPVLAFGETAEIEEMRCASASGGVTCTKVAGAGAGKGFRINAHEIVRVGSASSGSTPNPSFGRTATLKTVSGTVLIEQPGSHTFVPLSTLTSVPLGTTIDTTNGTVQLTSATSTKGGTETGQFYSGIFKVTQTRARSPLKGARAVGFTVLSLTGGTPSGCASATRASSASTHEVRRLWGDAHGNFRTAGRYASATVRGTKWLTEDTCAGTLVKVARGVVAVEDLRTHRTALVRAGHSVLSGVSGQPRRPVGKQTIYFWTNTEQPIAYSGFRNPLIIEPRSFLLFQDGQWILEDLHWTGWGTSVARARGISNSSDDIPDAASGKRIKTWGEVTLSNSGQFKGHEVYRCFAMRFPPPATNLHGCLKRTGSIYGLG
jgi:hypothetical protein